MTPKEHFQGHLRAQAPARPLISEDPSLGLLKQAGYPPNNPNLREREVTKQTTGTYNSEFETAKQQRLTLITLVNDYLGCLVVITVVW